jgi:hypothetical protein
VTVQCTRGAPRDKTAGIWHSLPKIPISLPYSVDITSQSKQKVVGSPFIYSSSINSTILVVLLLEGYSMSAS